MERCVPQGFVSAQTAGFPQVGQGTYIGKMPGSSNAPEYISAGYSGGSVIGADSGVIIQTDTGYISTLSAQPQNVLRITGAGGAGYIQGTNIRFSVPFSGAAGVAILPSTGAINATSLNFVSTISPIGSGGTGFAGIINMTQLTSTIKGNNWAQVL